MIRFRSLLFCLFLVLGNSLPAISQTTEQNSRPGTEKAKELAWQKHIVLYDTSAAVLINRIQDINTTINDMNDVMASGFDTGVISKDLPPIVRSIQIIKYNITSRSGSMNLRNLSLVTSILSESIKQLKNWQTSLFGYSTDLVSFTAQIRSMTHDSAFRQLPADTALRFLYNQQLGELKAKWRTEDSLVRKSLVRINTLQSEVSDNYLVALELQGQIATLIRDFWDKALGQEYPNLWEEGAIPPQKEGFRSILQKTAKSSRRVLSYYLATEWDIRAINILIFLVFFFWTFFNLRRISRRKENPIEISQKLQFIQTVPVWAAFVVMLNIMPLINERPPAIYTVGFQLILAISLSFLLARRWPRKLFWCWIIVIILFEIQSFGNLLVSSSFMPRIWLLSIDLFSAAFGLVLIRQIRANEKILEKYLKGLSFLYFGLNLLALICNLLGRVTMAGLLSTTAVATFFLGISLSVFIRIILEAVFLQLEGDKNSERFTALLRYENIETRVKGLLLVLAGLFWFVKLTQYLNIYDNVYNLLSTFLGAERQIGSTSFTYGSLLLFVFVIWIANLIQKYIGFFFTGDKQEWASGGKTGVTTSVLLIRLVIMVVGFLLGIAASGLPVDKITVVIGALGVGVGLGLQGVVNQLVSGIILAIEKPIRVGDAVDIGGKSGRVREIGIRSTRLVTADGAEIIVPNADMLSQNLVNWTANNNHLRVEITVKIESGGDLDKVAGIIKDLLSKNEEVMKKPEPQLLFNSMDQTGTEIQVLFWVNDFNKSIQLKSDILRHIHQRCNQEGIKMA